MYWFWFWRCIGLFFFLIGNVQLLGLIGRFVDGFGEGDYDESSWQMTWTDGWKEWVFYGSVLLLLTQIAFPESL